MRMLISGILLFLAACGQRDLPADPASATTAPRPQAQAPAASPKAQHSAAAIAWFPGSVEDALSTAQAENRPLFLYWGAQWCPPCNQIKSTIFVREDFIARTRKFIAVYLDGDSEGAQRWGERFNTSGYPTLIVLQPDGTELTRLSSGMDAERYPEVLDLALARNRPVPQLLAQALANPAELTAEDWSLLALYSWGADNGRTVAAEQRPEALRRLAAACPASHTLPRQRLRLLAAIDSMEAGEPLPDGTAGLLRELVDSPAARRMNLTELQYYGADLLAAAIPADSPARRELTAQLRSRMQQVFDDESLPIKQRLLSTRLLIDLAALEDKKQSEAMQQLARERARWADEQATTPYLRQSLIYNAAWYLHDVGLSQEALSMFEAELERAVSPHYYMSYLALVEEDLGHTEEAVTWARKAWQEASGPATRTQWGTTYAQTLMRLDGGDDAVRETVTRLLDEMQAGSDGFYQRSLKRMQRLNTALQEWADKDKDQRQPIAQELRTRLHRMCLADQGEAGGCGEFS